MKRPKVTTKCVADRYAAPNERIVEFSAPSGAGGLMSFVLHDDGTLTVDLYRLSDTTVRVSEVTGS